MILLLPFFSHTHTLQQVFYIQSVTQESTGSAMHKYVYQIFIMGLREITYNP
jgi:hypothetical protein